MLLTFHFLYFLFYLLLKQATQVITPRSSDSSLASGGKEPKQAFKITLGDTELHFTDGDWTASGGACTHHISTHYAWCNTAETAKGPKKLQRENKKLQEQNNLLLCKVDLLVDMVGPNDA